MKNSGLVAVGHILAAKDQRGCQKALRHFCSIMLNDSILSEHLVDKSASKSLLDKFVSEGKATVENFSTFLTRILMKHDIDEQNIQLKVKKYIDQGRRYCLGKVAICPSNFQRSEAKNSSQLQNSCNVYAPTIHVVKI